MSYRNNLTTYPAKNNVAKEAFYWLSRKRHAGYDRSELPQVPHDKEGFVIDQLNLKHRRVFARDIKPAQKHILKSKVIDKIDTGQHKRKYIVSKDWYLVDGHHSWATLIPDNESMDIYQSDMNIDELIRVLKDDFGYGSKDIKDKPMNEDFFDNEEISSSCASGDGENYCNPTYQRILKTYRSVAEVDKNRAKSLFQFLGKRFDESIKDFCKRASKKTLKRIEFELGNLSKKKLNEDLSMDITQAIELEIITEFEGFMEHEKRHDLRNTPAAKYQWNDKLLALAKEYDGTKDFNPIIVNSTMSSHFAEYILDHRHAGNKFTYMVGTPETHVMIYDSQKKLYYDAVNYWGTPLEDLYYGSAWIEALSKKYDPVSYMQ